MENKKQLSDELLNEIAEMQKRFDELYCSRGLISLSRHSGVHLTEGAFLEIFDKHESLKREDQECPEELFAYHNGVKFFCIR